MYRIGVLLLIAAIGLSACNPDTPRGVSFEEQLATDKALIDSYLTSKGINATTDPDGYGVKYVESVAGAGMKPKYDADSITVIYKLRLLPSETQVDASSTPVSFLLGGLIDGWRIGLPLISEGSKATFFVPSGLGYGSTPRGAIPSNSNLIFDVELQKVIPQLKKDTVAIYNYLVAKEIKNVLKGPEGLKYVITSIGTGAVPNAKSTVTFSYSASTLRGNNLTLFDRPSTPAKIALSALVNERGLRIGLTLIPVGTKATFYIPSTLGYGLRSNASIPSNSNLVYDVELTEVSN